MRLQQMIDEVDCKDVHKIFNKEACAMATSTSTKIMSQEAHMIVTIDQNNQWQGGSQESGK